MAKCGLSCSKPGVPPCAGQSGKSCGSAALRADEDEQGGHRYVSSLVRVFNDTCFQGYKLWKHIAKALQTRSAAIKVALDRYNKCALVVQPPRQMLQWEEFVEYTFLADFDLLRDTCEDISQCPWAHPTARFTLDTFFKMCQAEEEIACLNIEIR
ncbi:hypothetical protein PISMIDRAFT_114769 [Pisolithus microcarpus 441]|uniref:Uncharacterized protein n=1 Tax=Pisolithus microcarpus 441 TaxID=765257 RepID=A0A0C9YGA3_9AGAM|nr:hypothetical protein PISMIDRAFT_114769 [Pisolithus microcarpus 441]